MDTLRKISFLVILTACALLAVCLGKPQGKHEDIQKILEYNDAKLAKKYLVPDSQGRTDPLFSDLRSNISLIELIANPQKFDNKPVRTYGFASIEFEQQSLFVHETDKSYAITLNGIEIDTHNGKWENSKTPPELFNNKWVLIEGVFSNNRHQGPPYYSGIIRDIWRIQVLQKLR